MGEVILMPGYVSKRNPPINLLKEDEYMFQHEYLKDIMLVKKITSSGNLVSGKGILITNSKNKPAAELINTATIVYWNEVKFHLVKWKASYSGKLVVLNSPVIYLIDSSIVGYFHWITDMLPRLIVGGDEMKKYPVLLPESCRQFDFITASLAIFGFTPLFLAEHKLYSLKEMVFISTFSTPGNYHDAIMKQMRGKFIGNYPITKRSKPVYISRAKATRRKVKNESSLFELFKETGVEIIEAENLSFLEQVELFSTVTIMISNHGAGLTNMIFMPPGSTVIEIRHSGDAHNNCYYALANALELNYYYQSSIQAEKEEDIHLSDITVDVDLLKSVIELALRQTDISGPMNTLLN